MTKSLTFQPSKWGHDRWLSDSVFIHGNHKNLNLVIDFHWDVPGSSNSEISAFQLPSEFSVGLGHSESERACNASLWIIKAMGVPAASRSHWCQISLGDCAVTCGCGLEKRMQHEFVEHGLTWWKRVLKSLTRAFSSSSRSTCSSQSLWLS